MSDWQITIPLSNVDIISSTGQLLVKTTFAFDRNDIIKINDIKATVTGYDVAWDFPNHTWILTVECDQMDQLKELLTYEVMSK